MALIFGVLLLLAIAFEAMQGAEAPWTIASVASNAGFTGSDLVIAVAVAYAESSGNPSAVGDSGDSIGLWQIDTRYNPQFDASQLTDPQYNANAAFSIWQQGGWSRWSTYNNGNYQNSMGQAQSDVDDLSADDSSDSGDDDNG